MVKKARFDPTTDLSVMLVLDQKRGLGVTASSLVMRKHSRLEE